MRVRKFKVKVAAPGADLLEDAVHDFKRLWKLAEKNRLDEDPYDLVVTLPDLSHLARIFSPGRMRLLMTVRDQKPESIYQLAKLLKRAPSNVKKDVDDLAGMKILKLKKRRTRRQGRIAVQPLYLWDGFDVAV